LSTLDLERPVLVKVDPPRDKRERERLRTLLEGKRVTIKGRTYHVDGLIKKLGGFGRDRYMVKSAYSWCDLHGGGSHNLYSGNDLRVKRVLWSIFINGRPWNFYSRALPSY